MTKNNAAKAEKNGKAKQVYKIVSGVVTALVFLFLCFVIVSVMMQKKGGGDINVFGHYMYDVLTDSMEGTIDPGDVIWSRKVESENDLKKDVIITFIAPSGPLKGYNVTHRIYDVQYNEDGSINFIKTKGDNETEVDSWELKPANVKAVYVKKLPFIAGLRKFMSTPAGYVVVIVLPLMTVCIMFIAGFVKDRLKVIDAKKKKEGEAFSADLASLSEDERKKIAEQIILSEALEKSKNDEEKNE